MTLLLPINLVLYVLSAVLLWRSLARTTSASWLLLIVPLAAIVTHAIVLWDYLNADHFDHLNITTSLSTVALLLAAFSLMRSRRAGGMKELLRILRWRHVFLPHGLVALALLVSGSVL